MPVCEDGTKIAMKRVFFHFPPMDGSLMDMQQRANGMFDLVDVQPPRMTLK